MVFDVNEFDSLKIFGLKKLILISDHFYLQGIHEHVEARLLIL